MKYFLVNMHNHVIYSEHKSIASAKNAINRLKEKIGSAKRTGTYAARKKGPQAFRASLVVLAADSREYLEQYLASLSNVSPTEEK